MQEPCDAWMRMYVCLPRACGVAKRRTAATREAAILKLSAMADRSSLKEQRGEIDGHSIDQLLICYASCCLLMSLVRLYIMQIVTEGLFSVTRIRSSF